MPNASVAHRATSTSIGEGATSARRVCLDVRGVVQGVGFRPFVVGIASRHGLAGHVANTSRGVEIEVEGDPAAVDAFLRDLRDHPPPLSHVLSVSSREVPTRQQQGMEIRASQADASPLALLPPDAALCEACQRELLDPDDRRFRYAFTCCTDCGPRYTVIDGVPHDRPSTTMAPFAMCVACRAEYEDPKSRRFHAQANCCPVCGPSVRLVHASGQVLAGGDPIAAACSLLTRGAILAIKGIGGFHLAVNARDDAAVSRLRERKRREAKPLALMCRDLSETERHVLLDDATVELLRSCAHPIVLAPKRLPSRLSPAVAPGVHHLGVMLPYSPLHVLLLSEGPQSLVMTSGNLSDEPIAVDNAEAILRLSAVADAFLIHDREILLGNDDSVARFAAGRPRLVRRSRGYVPLPIPLPRELPSVLAVGAELKNTVCLIRGDLAFMSQHIGDLDHAASMARFEATVARFSRILGAAPVAIARDLHPDYGSSRWAEAQGLPTVCVQHHHAHVIACATEHLVEDPVIGLALDGAGLGPDGAIWGGEILIASADRFVRAGHLGYVRQPGGDRGAREPYRMAIAHGLHALGDDFERRLPAPLRGIDPRRRADLRRIIEAGMCSPWTSSVGRLFDAVACLCGLANTNRFEADAAMALEGLAEQAPPKAAYPVAIPAMVDGRVVIDPALLVRPVLEDCARGEAPPTIARRFHRTVAVVFADACLAIQSHFGPEMGPIPTVALAGGCFANRVLLEDFVAELTVRGFRPIASERLPSGDGGLALGQAVIAAHALARAAQVPMKHRASVNEASKP